MNLDRKIIITYLVGILKNNKFIIEQVHRKVHKTYSGSSLIHAHRILRVNKLIKIHIYQLKSEDYAKIHINRWVHNPESATTSYNIAKVFTLADPTVSEQLHAFINKGDPA